MKLNKGSKHLNTYCVVRHMLRGGFLFYAAYFICIPVFMTYLDTVTCIITVKVMVRHGEDKA